MQTGWKTAVAILTAGVLTLSGCSASNKPSDADNQNHSAAADTGVWPRTIKHEAGETTIKEKPKRIAVTAISLTGILLAMKAPVFASAATKVQALTDDRGFFTQWAGVAKERGVEVLYPNLELDLEAVEAAKPDLIIGSVLGGDSTKDSYSQLSEIAPTVLLDYGKKSWEELAKVIGEVTGLENEAQKVVKDFDDYAAAAAKKIKVPDGKAGVITYNGPEGIAIFTKESPVVRVFGELGFALAEPPKELSSKHRSDAAFFTPENMAAALGEVKNLFIVPVGATKALEGVKSDALLANQPAVAAGNVHQLPVSAFRIDYYSGKILIDELVKMFGG